VADVGGHHVDGAVSALSVWHRLWRVEALGLDLRRVRSLLGSLGHDLLGLLLDGLGPLFTES
jgi:hypothetical protein